ncbi:hypothetical protein DFH06DRAFT_1130765 [Mycena polygramma]|nr:hypothetical protein DFH06DRAFT_1130765 [Mycena polygramma]
MAAESTLTRQATPPAHTGAVDPQAEQSGVPLRERTESLESIERLRNGECERAMEERARLRWEETLKRRAETKPTPCRHYVSAVLLKDTAVGKDATTYDAGQQDGPPSWQRYRARQPPRAALAFPAEARTIDEETALAIELPWQEWCERWCRRVEEEKLNGVKRVTAARVAEESRAAPKLGAFTAPRPILRRQGIPKPAGQPCVEKRVRLEKPEHHRATLKMGSANTETTNAVVAYPVQGASSHATLPARMPIEENSPVPDPATMAQDNAYVEVAVDSCAKNGKRRREDVAEEGGETKRQRLSTGGASSARIHFVR